MTTWSMKSANTIQYGADTVASVVQKTIGNFEHLFELVNLLHSGEGIESTSDVTVAKAGTIEIDSTNNGVYIKNSDNTDDWTLIGYALPNFGITPETINAVKNGGNIGAFYAGTTSTMNALQTSGLKTNDIFFATDTFRIYRWTGSAWVCFLSKNFSDILDYEKYCISREEVADKGKGKIPRLDSATGKGNFDITGSPDRIFDKEIDFQNLQDGQAIVFNAEKNKWVNLPNWTFTNENLTYTGEKSTTALPKIVAVGKDGKIHGDFSGNTDRIGNIEVKTNGIKNNWVLAYDSANNCFKPVGKITGNAGELAGIKIEVDPDTIQNDDVLAYDAAQDKFVTAPRDSLTGKNITTTGEAKKIVKVADDGFIYGKFKGGTSQLADTNLEITDLTDGDVIVYHKSTNTFRNEPKNIIANSGSGQSLILYDRTKVIGDYNGSKTVSIDISKVVSRAGTVSYVNHSMRLLENLYLAMDFNNMNFGGRDGLITEFFTDADNTIDKTSVNVSCLVAGDDSIDVDSVDGLIVGANYLLVEGDKTEDVVIKEMIISGSVNRLILEKPLTKVFTPNETKLCRSTATFGDGFVTGENAVFTTRPFIFDYVINRAHMTVKHQNVPDTEITAEMSIQHDAEFINGEIIGIGDGTEQTVTLANTLYVSSYGFNLYFDGVKQESGFVFSPSDGKVTFTAANGVVVQADYIYKFNFGKWIPMHRALTYPDIKNHDRATTQFHFAPAISENTGKIAAVNFKLKSLSGTVKSEIIGTGNDKPQGFKLPHHAIESTISVTPSTATWTYKEDLDTIVINAPDLETIKISYDWKARPCKIDSFAVLFNE